MLLENGPQHRAHHQLVLIILLTLSIGLPILRYCLVDEYKKSTETYWITLGLINAAQLLSVLVVCIALLNIVKVSTSRGLNTKNKLVYGVAYSCFIAGQAMLSLTKAITFTATWHKVLYFGLTQLVLWISSMSLVLILHQLALYEQEGQACIQESIFLDLSQSIVDEGQTWSTE